MLGDAEAVEAFRTVLEECRTASPTVDSLFTRISAEGLPGNLWIGRDLVVTNFVDHEPGVEMVLVGRTVVDQPIPPSCLVDVADLIALREWHQQCSWTWPDTLECGVLAHVLGEFLANCRGERDAHAAGLAAENRALRDVGAHATVRRSFVKGAEDTPRIERAIVVDGVTHREVIQADSHGRIVSVTCVAEGSEP
ncbi:MAG: hypothetical protein R3E12_18905 [Candidatus Eisenbacteria bacterium]|uniref:Uncharacterized protein n=1 Tax=Eiseniibacteriota bacterium TaxID=2212470 RepID=A0A956M2L3_UNCEI|nr:hypothetical protein [Candidatus Eisenbacteria bacterium]